METLDNYTTDLYKSFALNACASTPIYNSLSRKRLVYIYIKVFEVTGNSQENHNQENQYIYFFISKISFYRGANMCVKTVLCPHVLLSQYARTCRTGDGVGARKFRLKRRRVPEHFDLRLRRRRGGSGPRRNVVVECRRLIKHVRHISHSRRVPTPDVLVESICHIEGAMHSSHLRRVPTPNVLVESNSIIKCLSHIRHFRCIPTPNGLVERFSAIKQSAHVCHFRRVPSRNIVP